MEAPEKFLRRYLTGRNELRKRHATEYAAFEEPYCRDFPTPTRWLADYEGEQILEVTAEPARASVVTSGHNPAPIGGRLRYQLTGVDGEWFIADWEMECSLCQSGQKSCPSCKGEGWISMRKKGLELFGEA